MKEERKGQRLAGEEKPTSATKIEVGTHNRQSTRGGGGNRSWIKKEDYTSSNTNKEESGERRERKENTKEKEAEC